MSYKKRDLELEYMGFENYKEYLESDLWKSIKSKKICEQNKCLLCSCKENLVIHHYDYSRDTLEGRALNNLIVLCHKCHASIEFFIRKGKPIKRTLKAANGVLASKLADKAKARRHKRRPHRTKSKNLKLTTKPSKRDRKRNKRKYG